jgi:hypothetical protein
MYTSHLLFSEEIVIVRGVEPKQMCSAIWFFDMIDVIVAMMGLHRLWTCVPGLPGGFGKSNVELMLLIIITADHVVTIHDDRRVHGVAASGWSAGVPHFFFRLCSVLLLNHHGSPDLSTLWLPETMGSADMDVTAAEAEQCVSSQ